MRHQSPFTASGTATFPGHRFIFTPVDAPDNHLKTFVVGSYPENIYVYDPFLVEGDPAATEKNLKVLKKAEREQYDNWRKTLLFNEQYRNFTGRSYLANYMRKPPGHFMWRADYFGQEHWVTTRETHFVTPPPDEDLDVLLLQGSKRVLKTEDSRLLSEYRDADKTVLNMTLKVLSVAPRVFEIPNFLSDTEINHILAVAGGENLHLSTTGDLVKGEKQVKEDTRRTRTSYNSWVPRNRSPIFDAIYRRAADLMRIDEALLRERSADEVPELKSKRKISEDLQLVHYEGGQEYTAHHDFGFSRIDDESQGARFATILFYLNEGMTGGETSFPRYVNAETFKSLEVTPERGKAVLFYSQLPDGNLDDFSQHAANPVTDGEKVNILNVLSSAKIRQLTLCRDHFANCFSSAVVGKCMFDLC